MIAATNRMNRGALKARQKRLDGLSPSKRIFLTLHEQHGFSDVGQMRITPLLRLAGRVQWIAEQQYAANSSCPFLGRDVRRHTAAHRFAADEERKLAELLPRRVNRLTPR